MSNNDILKMNNGKKFDVCLMNPPYGSKKSAGNPHLHFEFTNKCSEISNTNICVMPFRMFTSTSKEYNKYKELYNDILIGVEEVDSSIFSGTSMENVGIYHFGNKKSKSTYIKDKNGKEKEVENLLNLSTFTDYENEIKKYLLNEYNLNFNPFRPIGKDKNEELVNYTNKYCKRFNDKLVFLTTNLANGSINAKFISGNAGKILNGIDELKNEIYRTKGAAKVIMEFKKLIEAENCKIALQNPVLRFGLYKLQDDQNMTARTYKCVPDIDWSNHKVRTDEGLLELCGCPKDKCKEYADYCKDIIERVDKGERP